MTTKATKPFIKVPNRNLIINTERLIEIEAKKTDNYDRGPHLYIEYLDADGPQKRRIKYEDYAAAQAAFRDIVIQVNGEWTEGQIVSEE